MVIVHVWNYGGLWKGAIKHTRNVGHAAISITTGYPNKSVYISWWPGAEEREEGTFGVTSLADFGSHMRIWQDFAGEGDKPRNASKGFKELVQLIGRLAEGKTLSGKEWRTLSQNPMTEQQLNTAKLVKEAYKTTQWDEVRQNTYNSMQQRFQTGQTSLGEQDLRVELGMTMFDEQGRRLPPDDNTRLPSLADQYVGLDSHSMLAWWTDWANLGGEMQKKYKFKSQNCSTIAYYALVAGGADRFGMKGAKMPYQPAKIKERAHNLLVNISQMNRKCNAFITNYLPHNATGFDWDLWTQRKWLQESSVKHAHRYAMLKKVDQHVGNYHRIQGQEDDPKVIAEKMWELANILVWLHDIMKARPRTKRSQPIFTLGVQAASKIHSLRTSYKIHATTLAKATYDMFYEV